MLQGVTQKTATNVFYNNIMVVSVSLASGLLPTYVWSNLLFGYIIKFKNTLIGLPFHAIRGLDCYPHKLRE